MYISATEDFWQRHQWINSTLAQRIKILAMKYPSTSQNVDPMLLFTSLTAQMTVLYLCKTMKTATPLIDGSRAVIAEYERSCSVAVQEIVNLTKQLTQFSCFKVSRTSPFSITQ